MAVGLVVVALLAGPAWAESALSLSGRYHRDRTEFAEYPFGDGDLSYMAAWETHNEDAMIQLGAAVCPSFEDNEALDYAITPQANLILKDRIYRGGLGILSSYTKGDDEDDWTDMYWQFLLGLSFGLPARLTVDVFAIYPFESWGDLSDFSTDDIEFSAGLAWHF
jgi:hypothetical protein